jgi:hypothetical protein
VKKSRERQEHFTPRRKAEAGAKRTKPLFNAGLCALASWREIVYFFAASGAGGAHFARKVRLKQILGAVLTAKML